MLDLGCGQGRDALVAARLGHRVTAIDLAQSGIDQLRRQAEQEGLNIRASVADARDYSTTEQFDVVILDRVLHMLPSPESIRSVLINATSFVTSGGWVMVADTRKNRPLIRGFFEQRGWSFELRRKDFTICRKLLG